MNGYDVCRQPMNGSNDECGGSHNAWESKDALSPQAGDAQS